MGLKQACLDDPQVRAAVLAREWAQQIGLNVGTLWEPAIARNIVKEFERLGGDPSAWGLVEALYRLRLGLDPPPDSPHSAISAPGKPTIRKEKGEAHEIDPRRS